MVDGRAIRVWDVAELAVALRASEPPFKLYR
jgi:hypothetical protein